jgi:hypothetical protein
MFGCERSARHVGWTILEIGGREMRRAFSILALAGLAVAVCGCESLQQIDLDRLSELVEQWEASEEHVWGEGCVFENAKPVNDGTSQANESWQDFANPWVLSGLVATAIVIPLAIDDDYVDPNDRLVVTDTLRAACLDTCYLADDEEIVHLLSIVAQYQDNGVDYQEIDLCSVIDEELEPVGQPGSGEGLPYPREACEECLAAIVDHIYFYWWAPDGP